jgi:hypothetical protein
VPILVARHVCYIEGMDSFEVRLIELSVGQTSSQSTKCLDQPSSTGHQEHPTDIK